MTDVASNVAPYGVGDLIYSVDGMVVAIQP